MKLLWLFVLINLLIGYLVDCEKAILNDGVINKIQLPSLTTAELTNFIHYHYYFHTSKSSSPESWMMCSSNRTEHALISKITKCANSDFFPRIVENSQISWKSVKKSSHRNNRQKNNNNTSTNGHSSSSNSKDNGSKIDDDDLEDSRTMIHQFMAFALVLPQHPFSSELIHALRVTAPMFPQIHVVVGNGYEFSSMSTQYGISSYPQVLLFTKGFLRTKLHHRAAVNVTNLALEFATWTKSFPSTYPNIPTSIKRSSNHNKLSYDYFNRTFYQFDNFLFGCTGQNTTLCDMLVNLAQYLDNTRNYLLKRIVLRHSLEPIMGTLESAIEMDKYGYFWLSSGCYVFIRALFLLWQYIKRRAVA